MYCGAVHVQPLLLKDNFFHTPRVVELGGIEPILK